MTCSGFYLSGPRSWQTLSNMIVETVNGLDCAGIPICIVRFENTGMSGITLGYWEIA